MGDWKPFMHIDKETLVRSPRCVRFRKDENGLYHLEWIEGMDLNADPIHPVEVHLRISVDGEEKALVGYVGSKTVMLAAVPYDESDDVLWSNALVTVPCLWQ